MTRCALIVDDNRSLAEDLGEILADEGYTVRVFDDPAVALRETANLHFDVALLDVRMPGMDGVTLHSHLMRTHPDARFVLMTAYTEDERIAQALSAGVRAVLTKPVPLAQLLSVIDQTQGLGRDLLIVEDDGSFSEALGEVLEESGYNCRRVRSASEARLTVPTEALAAVIVDVRLPDADGATLAVELSQRSGAPVVLITGFDPEEPQRLLDSELGERARLLVKPFSPAAMLGALSELRGEHR